MIWVAFSFTVTLALFAMVTSLVALRLSLLTGADLQEALKPMSGPRADEPGPELKWDGGRAFRPRD